MNKKIILRIILITLIILMLGLICYFSYIWDEDNLTCQRNTYKSIVEKYPENYDMILENYCTDAKIKNSAAWLVIESNYNQYKQSQHELSQASTTILKYSDCINLKLAKIHESTYRLDDYNESLSLDELVKLQSESEEVRDFLGHKIGPFRYFHITGMSIMNGNNTSLEEWEKNSRAKKIKVTINKREEYIYNLEDTIDVQLIDLNYTQYRNSNTPIDIKIEILEKYDGNESDDVFISDIRFGMESSVDADNLPCQKNTYKSILEKYPKNYYEILEKYCTDAAELAKNGYFSNTTWIVIESNYNQYQAQYNKRRESITILKDSDILKYSDCINLKLAKIHESTYNLKGYNESLSFDKLVKLQSEEAIDSTGKKIGPGGFFHITGMSIMNGNNTSLEEWEKNSRAKKIKVIINNNKEYIYNLEDTIDVQLIDLNYTQNSIDKPIDIKIEILEKYDGNESDDVFISDIRFGMESSVDENDLSCQKNTYKSIAEKYPENYYEISATYCIDALERGDIAAWPKVESNYNQYQDQYRQSTTILKYSDCINFKLAEIHESTYNLKGYNESLSFDKLVKLQSEEAIQYYPEKKIGPDGYFKITGMSIMNGNNTSLEEWEKNSRAKKIKVIINNNKEYIYNLEDTIDVQLIDLNYTQKRIDKPIDIKIEILEKYDGNESNDVFISDIRFGMGSSISGSR